MYIYCIYTHISTCSPSHSSPLISMPCVHLSLCSSVFLSSSPSFHLAVCLCVTWLYPMTADMRQFSFVNDKKCGNYLSGCFTANQTLTSCERVCSQVCVSACGSLWVWHGMRTGWTKALLDLGFCRYFISWTFFLLILVRLCFCTE